MFASFVGDAGAWASLVLPLATILIVVVQRITRLLDKIDDLAETTAELTGSVDDLTESAETTQRIVRHHLGENGETTPIRVRLSALERANGITPPDH